MANDTSVDLFSGGKPANAELAGIITEQAQEMYRLERCIENMKLDLKSKQEQYRILATEKLPGLMQQFGTDGFPLANGYTLVIEPAFRANLPAESTIEKADEEERPMLERRREEGLRWLQQHNASAIIKNEIKVKLGTGQSALARAVMTALRNFSWKVKGKIQKVRLDFDQKESVHPGTLSKLLKELRDNGVDLPLDTFAVFDGKEATIKPPKGKKEEKNGKS